MGEQAMRPLNQQHKAELVPGSCPQRCGLPSRGPHSQGGWARTGEITGIARAAYGTPNAEGTVADSAAAERFPDPRRVLATREHPCRLVGPPLGDPGRC